MATGIEEHDDYGRAFIEATRLVRERLPGVHVSGGVSNLSFSFRGNNAVREAMHAVFLYHAVAAGMDFGIVNAGQLSVYTDVPERLRVTVEDVILNSHPGAGERLLALAQEYQGESAQRRKDRSEWRALPLAERLRHALVHGLDEFVVEDTEAARRTSARALDVIEGPLMDGMNTVGDLFGSGKMFLAAGGQVRPRHEEGGGAPAALHRAGRQRNAESWTTRHGDRQGEMSTISARTSWAWCCNATATRSSTWGSWRRARRSSQRP